MASSPFSFARFDLKGRTAGRGTVNSLVLSYNSYAPLPLNSTLNSTFGAQLRTRALQAAFLSQTNFQFTRTDSFPGNLSGPSGQNPIGTWVSLIVNGNTIIETAVIGVANGEAGSDALAINKTDTNHTGMTAGAIISPVSGTASVPRGSIFFNQGPSIMVGGLLACQQHMRLDSSCRLQCFVQPRFHW